MLWKIKIISQTLRCSGGQIHFDNEFNSCKVFKYFEQSEWCEDCSGGSQLLLQICLYFIILNISNIVSRFRILKWLLPNIIIAAGFTLLWGLMQGFSFPIAFTAVSVSLFPNSLISVKNASSCPSKVELIIPVLFTPQYSSLSNIERWFKFHWE